MAKLALQYIGSNKTLCYLNGALSCIPIILGQMVKNAAVKV
jgi:hypothetical protein